MLLLLLPLLLLPGRGGALRGAPGAAAVRHQRPAPTPAASSGSSGGAAGVGRLITREDAYAGGARRSGDRGDRGPRRRPPPTVIVACEAMTVAGVSVSITLPHGDL